MIVFFIFILIIGIAICLIIDSRSKKEKSPTDAQQPAVEQLIDLETETKRIQAFIQAGIVGDTLTADSLSSGTYTGPLPEPRSDGGWLSIYDNLRILKIAGINHRQGISRYVGRVECALVPEPENEYDPDAIKVVAEDRHHLGYIQSGQTDLVCSLTANEFPYRCTAFIEQCDDEDDGHKFYTGFVYIRRLD